jgi:hypothetical protein
MPPTEQSPLLDNQPRPRRSLYQSFLVLVRAEGEPSWLDSYRWFIFGSWLNILLLLVPVAAASHYLNWDAPLRFGFSFVAIIPLAKVRPGPLSELSRAYVGFLLSYLAMPLSRCLCPSDKLSQAC